MNGRPLQLEFHVIRTHPFDSPRGDEAEAPDRTPIHILMSALIWATAGTAVFFLLYGLTAPGLNPSGTLAAASLSGLCGVIVCSLPFRCYRNFRILLLLLVAAYVLRLLVGIWVYLDEKDGDYFSGNGSYQYHALDHEFYWTYKHATQAADILSRESGKVSVISRRDDKNLNIHLWMGSFLAVGGSRHALDLAPFNAFHHLFAGILMISLALACGYPLRIAFLSGALTAWIPWAFAASVMWRDSVGFAWMVLSVAIICLGRELPFVAGLLVAMPAAYLAWSDRSPYFLAAILITLLSVLWDRPNLLPEGPWKLAKRIFTATLLAVGVLLLWHYISAVSFEGHELQASGESLSHRLLVSPLLVLRALAGPFPWFFEENSGLRLFDYLFHVMQLGVFLICVTNFRRIGFNLLTYSAAIFWTLGFMGGGVHTAYLAVAYPFVLPSVLNTGASLPRYLLISGALFVVANTAYILSGLSGSGLIMNLTGY